MLRALLCLVLFKNSVLLFGSPPGNYKVPENNVTYSTDKNIPVYILKNPYSNTISNKTTHTLSLIATESEGQNLALPPCPPVLVGVPADATVECDNPVVFAPPIVTVTTCCVSYNLTFHETKLPGNCAQNFVLVRTWTATACGNIVEQTQHLTVRDTKAPFLGFKNPIFNGMKNGDTLKVKCGNEPVFTQADFYTIDLCDMFPVFQISDILTYDTPCKKIIKCTVTLTDNCGNVATLLFYVQITDTDPPSLDFNNPLFAGMHNGDTLKLQCGTTPVFGPDDFKTVDGCDAHPFIKMTDIVTLGPCLILVKCVVTACDKCGNCSTLTFYILVSDTKPPVFNNCPSNLTLNCTDAIPPPTSVTITDNCDKNPVLTYKESKTNGPCPQSYTLTRTWTATDNCFNVSTCKQTIKVTDKTPPVITPGNTTITAECGGNIPTYTVSSFTVKDDCDNAPILDLKKSTIIGNCKVDGFVSKDSYTFTATDHCGNVSTVVIVVIVKDTKPPVLQTAPANVTIACGDAIPSPPVLTATDDCDKNVTVILKETNAPGNCPGNYSITRVWTATDACGNSATTSQKITVVDNLPPVFGIVPADVTLSCDVAIPPVVNPPATDKCDPQVIVTFIESKLNGNCPQAYTLTRTWTATDDCGNTAKATQKITIIDSQPPVISGVPADITIECDQAVPGLGNVKASDNCDLQPQLSITKDSLPGACKQAYTLIRTWKATDACGNTAVKTQKVVVQDTKAPVFTSVPANVTIQCNATVPGQGNVAASDNCDSKVDISFKDSNVPGSCPGNYTINRIYTAIDDCGNTSTATQKITVEDTTPPVLGVIPADITIQCDVTVPSPGIVTATDNCDQNVVVSSKDVSATVGCNKLITRTYTAVDNCGNTATKAQKILVVDTKAPVLQNPPANITLSCGDPVPPAATLTATDNCDPNPTVSIKETTTNGNCAGNYTITRIWTAVDNCGNSTTKSQIILVGDNTPPIFGTIPADVTINCDATVPAVVTPTATDLCDPQVDITFATSTVQGNCPQAFTIIRTWTATDDCGNTAKATQKITVIDKQAPVILGVPSDITLQCDQVNTGTGTVKATDNCDPNPVLTSVSDSIPGACKQTYTLIRTWKATDACGNTSTKVQKIVVIDTQAPIFTSVPANVTLECSSPLPGLGNATATDNCDTKVDISYIDVKTQGNCPEAYTLKRTFTAIDDCGNIATAIQIITVQDKTAPVIGNIPGDITIQCDKPIPPAGTVTATDNCDTDVPVTAKDVTTQNGCNKIIIRTYTATDDCGNVATKVQKINVVDTTPPVAMPMGILTNIPNGTTLTFNCDEVPFMDTSSVKFKDNCDAYVPSVFSEIVTKGDCLKDGYLLFLECSWTGTDDCGNTAVFTIYLKIIDNKPPVITNCPKDLTIECDQTIPGASGISVTDNCDTNVDVTISENTIPGSCPQAKVIVRTYLATDDCGNTAKCIQKITVLDTQAPIIIGVPENVTIQCDQPLPAINFVKAADNCDLQPVLTLKVDSIPGACKQSYTLIRTWKATDACGNTSTKSQIVVVVDTKAPVFTFVPANVTIECSDPLPGLGNTAATDNCDTNVDITYQDNKTAGNCPEAYLLKRVFTATDDCGNKSTAVQFISVQDNTPPVIGTIPADITVECDKPVPSPANVTAKDNCDPSVPVSSNDVVSQVGCNKLISRTYTATDDCGNVSTKVQKIHVVDTTPPVSMPMGILANVPYGATLTFNCDEAPSMDSTSVKFKDNCDTYVPSIFTEIIKKGDCIKDGYLLFLECTWTGTDDCGNTSNYKIFIKIVDTKAPVISNCPADITIECDQTVPAPVAITVTDNCDTNVDVNISENTIPGSCPQAKVVIRTYTATDDCGNTAKCVQKITVLDTQAPIIIGVPENITVQCDQPVPSLGQVKAADNCDLQPVLTLKVDSIPGPCKQSYTLIRTWKATDACGNSSVKTQKVVVIDTKPPVFTFVPANITIECSDPIPGLGNVAATDNCDTKVDITYKDDKTQGNCPQAYSLLRRYTAIDDCGNSATATQVITVQDKTPPVIGNVPGDISIECDKPIPSPSTVSATDNCDPNVIVSSIDVTTQQGCNKLITRTYTATDHCGNVSTKVQKINIVDTTPPVAMTMGPLANVPNGANLIFNCDEAPAMDSTNVLFKDNCDTYVPTVFTEIIHKGNCLTDGYLLFLECFWTGTDDCGNTTVYKITVKIVDTKPPVITNCPADFTIQCDQTLPDATGITVTDNCDANVDVTYTENTIQGSCPQAKIVVRTYTATDDCGNTAKCTQKITVLDTQAPIIIGVPADVTIQCDQPVPGYNVKAADNCDPNVILVFKQDSIPGPCKQSYTLIRTWSATDACGNKAVKTQKVVVQDTKAPVFTVIPPSITIECSDPLPGLGNIIAVDNCDAKVFVTYKDVKTLGNCPQSYILTRTFTAQDACGNTATAIQLITVQDITPPVLVGVPADVTIECDAPLPNADNVSATDNCDPNPTVTYQDDLTGTGCVKLISRTFTATDHCGNSTTKVQKITTVDTTPPVAMPMGPLANVPNGAMLTFNCDEAKAMDSTSVIFKDNCDLYVPTVFTEIIHKGDCLKDGYLLFLECFWTGTDECGNTTVYQITVKIVDTKPPVISNCPADLTIECTDPIPFAGTVTATDNCDTHVDITINETTVPGPCPQAKTILRTYIATDDCGNTASCVQKISIVDTQAPIVVGVPANITVGCDAIPPVPNIATIKATDFCDPNPGISFSESIEPGKCPYKITRQWTATDACGNTATRTQVITVYDNTAPVITGIFTDVTVDLDNGGVVPGIPVVTVTDNCDKNVSLVYSEKSDTVKCNITLVRKWTATDLCNNISVKTQTILILKKCPCVDPITNVIVTDATCGLNNGKIEVQVSNGINNYDYSWIPNIGTPNAAGNIRTNLPPGNYTVILDYKNAANCLKKLTIKVADLKGNVIPENNLLIANHDCTQPVKVCLGLNLSEVSKYDVFDNGVKYNAAVTACDFDTLMSYSYATIPGLGNSGPYLIESWLVGGVVKTGEFANIAALVVLMNTLDPQGNWVVNKVTQTISGGVNGKQYGQIKIKQKNGAGTATLSLNVQLIPNGSAWSLPNGDHQLIFTNIVTGCKDTVNVKVFCLNTSIINTTVLVAKKKTVCLDVSQLPGVPGNMINICSGLSGEFSTLSYDNNTHCIEITGVEKGDEKACIVICDNLGFCDTTYINIHIVLTQKPIAIDDNITLKQGKSANLYMLTNDSWGDNSLDVFMISQPASGTAQLIDQQYIRVTADKDLCDPMKFDYAICNQYGCDTATVFVTVTCSDLIFFNAISPNGDGINDAFKIDGIEKYPNNKLSIFNRWGNEVYSKTGYQNEWKAEWSGKILPDGTYFYILEDGEGQKYSGYLQIQR